MNAQLDLFGRRRRSWKVRDFAARYDVTDRTVRRWIEKGAVEIERTPGGGVRIVESESGHSVTDRVSE